jgi:hypothetical protein
MNLRRVCYAALTVSGLLILLVPLLLGGEG